MRIVLSTISKFHTFDLARQMERLGVLERLFTGRPRWKLRGEGLPAGKVETFPWLQTIFEGMGRAGITRYPFQKSLNWLCHRTLDSYVARRLPPCDIFHALSYCGLASGQEAQRRGARWFCDAVNTHLGFQDDLLAEEHEALGLPYRRQDPRLLGYAVASYAGADRIIVPSSFVKASFLKRGIPDERLAIVPYGVDLSAFSPVPVERDGKFRVLFVGHLSTRKGLHHLARAFRLANIPGSEMLLVGSVQPETELLLREAAGKALSLIGPQPKARLPYYYSLADVLVLPSVEDGFGYVLGEALACGCPLIATEHTGGPELITEGRDGFVVPIRSPEAIAERLTWLYEHPGERLAMRQAALDRVRRVGGWDQYGEQLLQLFQDAL